MLDAIAVHVLRQRLHVLDGGHGQDSVSEIEDVTWAARRAVKDRIRSGEHPVQRRQKQRRIQVALDGAVGPDLFPRLIQRNAPVGADHVAARLAHFSQNSRRARAEVNGGNAILAGTLYGLENLFRVRHHELAIVRSVECSHPRIENLSAWTPASICAFMYSPMIEASMSQRRCHARGLPYISDLVRAKLFEWPP